MYVVLSLPPAHFDLTPPPHGPQIQRVLNREHEIAKQHLANGHRDRALIALRQRKYQETLLVKTDAQLEQLEQLVSPPHRVCDPGY